MHTSNRSAKLVAAWLLIGVGMTVIQIALGGITRLTGSGLSITQWDVITGSLPPLNHQQWLVEFEKYRHTPQYQLLNFEFSLADFKYIFFWEWFHRLWARAIGLVFTIGFVWFLVKKHFKKEMVTPLLILFLLGALQGAIGWIMVASGLTGDAVYVKPTRLALHFVFALGLLCYTFWFALKLLVGPSQGVTSPKLRKWNSILLVILSFQLLYGALMAGHKAATVAPTWPTINGQWLPDNLLAKQPLAVNFIDNTLLIHFIHRGLAYMLILCILVFTIGLYRVGVGKLLSKIRWIPLVLVLVQVVLGILTLFESKGIIPGQWGLFEWMAQAHQLTGMFLLLSLVFTLFLIQGKNKVPVKAQ